MCIMSGVRVVASNHSIPCTARQCVATLRSPRKISAAVLVDGVPAGDDGGDPRLGIGLRLRLRLQAVAVSSSIAQALTTHTHMHNAQTPHTDTKTQTTHNIFKPHCKQRAPNSHCTLHNAMPTDSKE
jgi:hypothetical protein